MIPVARYTGTGSLGLKTPGMSWQKAERLPDGRATKVNMGPSTYDWRYPPGSPENLYGMKARHEIVDLRSALTESYPDDRYVSLSVLHRDGKPIERQPRLTLPSFAWLRSEGFEILIHALMLDIECPGHGGWTPALVDRWRSKVLPSLPPWCGHYNTRHGARLFMVLRAPILPEHLGGSQEHTGTVTFSGPLGGFMDVAMSAGIAHSKVTDNFYIDRSCSDAYRAFRLPSFTIDGESFAPSECRYDVPAADAPPCAPVVQRRTFVANTNDPTVGFAATAFKLAGMLGQIHDGKVAAICPFASGHSRGTDYDTSTVIFAPDTTGGRWRELGWIHCSHSSCAGRRQRDFYDALPAEALSTALSEFGITEVVEAAEQPANDPTPLPARAVSKELEAAYSALRSDKAESGPWLFIAPQGSGKGHALREVAMARALLKTAEHKRPPPHSRTRIFGPTTNLTKQFEAELAEAGAPVGRDRGILDKDHMHLCVFGASGEKLLGGLPIGPTMCDGGGDERYACPHRDGCQAREGTRGDALITVSPQTFVNVYANSDSRSILWGIDEPPPPLCQTELPLTRMRIARASLVNFSAAFQLCGRVLLDAAIVLAQSMVPVEDRATSKPRVLLDAMSEVVNCEDINKALTNLEKRHADQELIRKERSEQRNKNHNPKTFEMPSTVPEAIKFIARAMGSIAPVAPATTVTLRNHVESSAVIGDAARVLFPIRIAASAPLISSVEAGVAMDRVHGVSSTLILTHIDPIIYAAFTRDAPVILTDAGLGMHLSVYTKIGQEFNIDISKRVFRYAVSDGCEGTKRILLKTRMATRTNLIHGDKPNSDIVASALKLAGAVIAKERPDTKTVLLGSFKVVATAEHDLSPVPGSKAWTHYGGNRGLNSFEFNGDDVPGEEIDAVVSIGDFRQPRDTVERIIAAEEDVETAVRARAAEEHAQFHGRARDPQRRTPALHIHVGDVVPAGWEQAGYEKRDVVLSLGKEQRRVGMAPSELQATLDETTLTQAEMASLAKVKKEAMSLYLNGKRTIPSDVAERVRAIAAAERDMGQRVPPADARAVIIMLGGPDRAANRMSYPRKSMLAYYEGREAMPRSLYESMRSWVGARPSAA